MADLSVRAPLDAEGLVDALFKRVDFKSAGFDRVVVLPRAIADTDSFAIDHDVVIWHCGSPSQPDWNVKAWVWRFALSLTVVNRDPDLNYQLCSFLHETISSWPYDDSTEFGRVGAIPDNPMFELVAIGDIVTTKTAVVRSCTKLIQAGSPR
jgi:hypothetical protein